MANNLNANEDKLSATDPLAIDTKTAAYDPLGPNLGSYVKKYYSDVKAPMFEAEHDATLNYKDSILDSVDSQKTALADYKTKYASDLSAANKESDSILSNAASSAPKNASQETVTVNLYNRNTAHGGADNRTEATDNKKFGSYTINAAAAQSIADELVGSLSGASMTGNSSANHSTYSLKDGVMNINLVNQPFAYQKALKSAYSDAQDQTSDADTITAKTNATNTAVYNAGMTGLQEQSAAAKSRANEAYNANVEQANLTIESTQAKWVDYATSLQENFLADIQTNNSGNKALVDSGALIFSGSVKK